MTPCMDHPSPRAAGTWNPVKIAAEFSPEAVSFYASGRTNLNRGRLKLKVKKHLVALGWKLEIKRDKLVRFRFFSPEGKTYYSLHQVCCDLLNGDQKADQRRRADDDPRRDARSCANLHPEPVSLAGDTSAHSWSKKRKMHQVFEHSSWPFSSGDHQNHSEVEVNCASSGKRIVELREDGMAEELKPECLPEAITEYDGYMESLKQNRKQDADVRQLRLNVKKHLLYMGWHFWLKKKKRSQELCYDSPDGKSYHSLASACKAYLECMVEDKDIKGVETDSGISCNLSEFGEAGSSSTLQWREVGNSKKRRRNPSFSHESFPSSHSSVCQQSKKRKGCQAPAGKGRSSLDGEFSRRVLRSSTTSAKTVLSWLIDHNVVLPRQKVSYMHKRDGHAMKEGQVNRDGIKCSCCHEVFGLAKFEAHAGCSTRHPSANIYLQDGRSLLQCQMQMMHANKPMDSPHARLKGDYSQCISDSICSVCQDGGMLMLCDHCPSSFHQSCVGLEVVPKGKWFCPSCRCGICGLGEYNCDMEQFTEKTMLYCDQCEREYHVGCLREEQSQCLSHCPVGNWFCSKKCSKIFRHLHKLLGKSHPTSVEGLSWTILRSRENGVGLDNFDPETMAEHHSKLCIALDVLHECFVTMIEPRTNSDVVADILFNKKSELDRLNFWGFYTMLLEKGDELISVATFRVYGEEVAEMPFVGTRVQHRWQGMCRLLMNELEKLLSSLGVGKLLLPAVPQLLETWTTSFGFTKMTSSDLLHLSEYALLSFQDTTMCQKLLRTTTAAVKESRGSHNPLVDTSSHSDEQIDCDDNSIDSEVQEMVEPTWKSPSLLAGLCSLSNGDTVKEITCGMDSAHSPPVSSCNDPLVETLQEKTNEQTTVSVVAGECQDSFTSAKTSPSTVLEKPATEIKYKFSGKCYERHGNSGASRAHLVRRIDVRNAGSIKYIYQRRTLTT